MKGDKGMKKVISIISIVLVLSLSHFVPTYADTAYKTVTVNKDGNYIETQTAYKPVETIEKIGNELLSAPSDMVIRNNKLYIADTGNKRIIVSSLSGDIITVFGNEKLKKPTGVFVKNNGQIMVADCDSKAVFTFDENGNEISKITKPSEPLYGKKQDFVPVKVSADNKDNIYVVCKGNGNGVVQISEKTSEFLGYFGANNVSMSLWDRFFDAIFTDEQKSQLKQTTPASISNVAIDKKGIVYTMTDIKTDNVIRKLNMSGNDILNTNISFSNPADLCVGSIGNIYAVTTNGYILEYNSEGDLLFAFGGFDDGSQRIGLFSSISSIATDNSGKLYVLDDTSCQIQIFEPTEFTNNVHTALDLYSQGKYLESKKPWEKVLLMNNLFDYAHKGMAEAYYMEGNYEKAMEEFRLSNNQYSFSEAFTEYRNQKIRDNITLVLIAFIAVIGSIFALLKIKKKKKVLAEGTKEITRSNLKNQLLFIFDMPKNPFDANYGIKRENKVSTISATILYLLFVVIYIIDKYCRGYIFSGVTTGQFYVIKDIAVVIGIMALFILCHYLVCSITEGEASLKNIYCAVIYSLMPYIILRPFVIVLTHVLTVNEIFLINILNFLIYVGCAILLVIMINQQNNYKVGETVKCIFWTLFSIIVAIAVLFILYVMAKQTVGFVSEIWNEVTYNVKK